MFRFEKTTFGYRAYCKTAGNCFVYFGHFRTQKEAKSMFSAAIQCE